MQEFSVTVRGHHHKITRPFFVLATQNPIELEGTYPLPEAQLDRFLFNVLLDYLSAEDEVDSFVTRFSPGVRVEAGSEINRVSATLQSEFGRFADSSIDNYADHELALQWAWNPMVRHALVVDADWARRHDARGTAGREGDLATLPFEPELVAKTERDHESGGSAGGVRPGGGPSGFSGGGPPRCRSGRRRGPWPG